jgi:hypothetical protein
MVVAFEFPDIDDLNAAVFGRLRCDQFHQIVTSSASLSPLMVFPRSNVALMWINAFRVLYSVVSS